MANASGLIFPKPMPGNGYLPTRQNPWAFSTKLALWKWAKTPMWCCGVKIPSQPYSQAEQVFIDGALVYDRNKPEQWPVSDFELGQPGEGDAK